MREAAMTSQLSFEAMLSAAGRYQAPSLFTLLDR
jgi:hypothetical protein